MKSRTQNINHLHRLFLQDSIGVVSSSSMSRYEGFFVVTHALLLNDLHWIRNFLCSMTHFHQRSELLWSEDALQVLILDYEAALICDDFQHAILTDWTQMMRSCVPMISKYWDPSKTVLEAWIQLAHREESNHSFSKALQEYLVSDEATYSFPIQYVQKNTNSGIFFDMYDHEIQGCLHINKQFFLVWTVLGKFTVLDIFTGRIVHEDRIIQPISIDWVIHISDCIYIGSRFQLIRLDIKDWSCQVIISEQTIQKRGEIRDIQYREEEIFVLFQTGLAVVDAVTGTAKTTIFFTIKENFLISAFRFMVVLSADRVVLGRKRKWQVVDVVYRKILHSHNNKNILKLYDIDESCFAVATSEHFELFCSQNWNKIHSIDGEWKKVEYREEHGGTLLLQGTTNICYWQPNNPNAPFYRQIGSTKKTSNPDVHRETIIKKVHDTFKNVQSPLQKNLETMTSEERSVFLSLLEEHMGNLRNMSEDRKQFVASPIQNIGTEEGEQDASVQRFAILQPPMLNLIEGVRRNELYIAVWGASRGTILPSMPQDMLDNHALDESRIFVYSCQDGRLICELEGHDSPIVSLMWLSTNILVSASQDGEVKLWDMKTHACTLHIQAHNSSITHMQLWNHRILTTAEDGSVHHGNWRELSKKHKNFQGHVGMIQGVCCLSETRVISWGDDRKICIWDIETGIVQHVLVGHTYVVKNVIVVHPNVLLSVGLDNQIIEWFYEDETWCITQKWFQQDVPEKYVLQISQKIPRPIRVENGGIRIKHTFGFDLHWLNNGKWCVWIEMKHRVICTQNSQLQIVGVFHDNDKEHT